MARSIGEIEDDLHDLEYTLKDLEDELAEAVQADINGEAA